MTYRPWLPILFLARLTYAQSGVLTGKALDLNQVPIVAAKVYLQRNVNKESMTTTTDSAGVYRFKVENGRYTVRVEGEEARPVTVADDKVTKMDFVVTRAQFFDEPQFTVAGVTDNTYRGGHGSDTVLRSSEDLAKATAALSSKDSSGRAYERSAHPIEAVQEFQHAAQLNPSEANLFDWGTELLSHLAPQAAEEVFTKGVRLFPASARMLLGLGSSCYASGSYQQAAHWFFQASDVDPGDLKPYLFLGKVEAQEITESDGYQKRMERFARLRPDNALANYYYAVSIWKAKRNLETRKWLEKAIALDPHLDIAYLQLGIVAASEERYPDAIVAYRKALEQNPQSEEAHYRLSEAYRLTGERSMAEQESATYHQLSKNAAERLERERREIQQFVIALRHTSKP